MTGHEQAGPSWTGVDRGGPEWTGVDRGGPGWTRVDRGGPGWIELDWAVQADLDRNGQGPVGPRRGGHSPSPGSVQAQSRLSPDSVQALLHSSTDLTLAVADPHTNQM